MVTILEGKKRYAVYSVLLGLALAASGVLALDVQSQPAVVIKEQMCGMFDGDGNLYFSTDSHAVSTNSDRQNTKLTCKAHNVPNSTGKVVKYDADNNPFAPPTVPCTDGFGYSTFNWREVVSPSGEVTMQCHFKNSHK